MKWWSPPKQRQRWGDSHILPCGTWGQIFFDLFYVGGSINLGNILIDKPKTKNDSSLHSMMHVAYFIGAGLPVMMMWFDKMYYDARFTTQPGHDVCHRLWDATRIGLVAVALSRLRSADILENSCQHADMFELSCSLLLYSVSTMLQYMEVVRYGIGDQPAISTVARRDIQWHCLPTLFYFLATLESGISFYGTFDNDRCIGSNAGNDLNGDDASSSFVLEMVTYHRPILYCFASWISWVIVGYVGLVVWTPKRNTAKQLQSDSPGPPAACSWKEVAVPMNIHFCIHRYGEWFMLMFGESIISLLIVDGNNESTKYNIVFFSGLFSVVFLAQWHFRGQPPVADNHALSRSRHSNYVYTVLVPLYSLALIALGVSYKLFLYEFTSYYDKKYQDDGSQRRVLRLLGEEGANNDQYDQYQGAYDGQEGSDLNYYQGDSNDYLVQLERRREQYAANMFCVSLTLVLLSLDGKQLLHRGWEAVFQRALVIMLPRRWILFLMIKALLIIFLIVLCVHPNYHEPYVMVVCGLIVIVMQRYVQRLFFGKHRRGGPGDGEDDPLDYDHDEGEGEGSTTGQDENIYETKEDDDDDDAVSTWFLTGGMKRHHNGAAGVDSTVVMKDTLAVFERDWLLEESSTTSSTTTVELNEGYYEQTKDDVSDHGEEQSTSRYRQVPTPLLQATCTAGSSDGGGLYSRMV